MFDCLGVFGVAVRDVFDSSPQLLAARYLSHHSLIGGTWRSALRMLGRPDFVPAATVAAECNVIARCVAVATFAHTRHRVSTLMADRHVLDALFDAVDVIAFVVAATQAALVGDDRARLVSVLRLASRTEHGVSTLPSASTAEG